MRKTEQANHLEGYKKQETGKAAEEASAEESAGEQAVKLGNLQSTNPAFLSTVQMIPKGCHPGHGMP